MGTGFEYWPRSDKTATQRMGEKSIRGIIWVPTNERSTRTFMATLDNTAQSYEPAVSGWWIVACFAVAGLILLFAALIQQASKLSDTLLTLTGGRNPQTVQTEIETSAPAPEQNLLEPEADSVLAEAANNALVDEPVVAEEVTDALVAEPVADASVAEAAIDALVAEPVADASVAEEAIDALVAEPVADEVTEAAVVEPIADALVAEEAVDALVAEESTAAALGEVDALAQTAEVALETASANTALDLDDTSLVDEIIEDPITSELSAEDTTIIDLPEESLIAPENTASETELSLASLRRDVLTNMTQRSQRIRFEDGSTDLTPVSVQLLGQTFEDLFLYAESDIVIEVSSSDGSDDASNQALSGDRAQLIRAFLVDRGIEPARLLISLLPASAETDQLQYVKIQANL